MFGSPVLPEAPGLKLTGPVILDALCQSKYHFFKEENSKSLLAPSEGALGSQITFFFYLLLIQKGKILYFGVA